MTWVHTDMSLVVNFYLTNYCNLRCEHCCHDSGPDQKASHMTEEEFQYALRLVNSVKTLLKNEPCVYGFTGGEPQCHPSFVRWATRVYNGIGDHDKTRMELHTNGTIFRKDVQYGMFSTVIVSNDPYHRQQVPYERLKIKEYANTANVMLRSLNGAVKCKGRGRTLIGQEPGKYQLLKASQPAFMGCMNEDAVDTSTVLLDFGHERIRFCGENRLFLNDDNSIEYLPEYLSHPEDVIARFMRFRFGHINHKCADRCVWYRRLEGNER